MIEDWFEFSRTLAERIGNGFDDEDLQQEAVLAVLESDGMKEYRRKDFIEQRIRSCAKQVKPGRFSTDDILTDDGLRRIDVLSDTNKQQSSKSILYRRRGLKEPTNKKEAWALRNRQSGRCSRCGKKLLSLRYVHCETCRAKRSYLNRKRRSDAKQRRKSKYDGIIRSLGYEIETIKKTTKEEPKGCLHLTYTKFGKDRNGKQRLKCRICGKRFTEKSLTKTHQRALKSKISETVYRLRVIDGLNAYAISDRTGINYEDILKAVRSIPIGGVV